MVLSAMPIGDYDKRLLILTKEHGKITAFAKGARRPNSALLACSQPFTFGHFQIYMGRSSYTVMSAEILNYFAELREDLEAVYYGFYFCEFADYLTRENMDALGILKLLYQSLRVLSKKPIEIKLARYIFEIKILSLFGETPQVFECVNHLRRGHPKTTDQDGWGFSGLSGGLVCKGCFKASRDAMPLSPAAVYTLQFIVSTPVEQLYTFNVSDEVREELKNVTKQYVRIHVDKEFKSLNMVELFQ